MANEEHLEILKQGVEAWNAWREENLVELPDLLHEALLRETDFREALLRAADLREADLRKADLREADLHEADLREADLSMADLSKADLSDAVLSGANLSGANLNDTILYGAKLDFVFLRGVILRDTDFRYAEFDSTVLGFSDLRMAKGLKSVRHGGPSVLGMDVLQASHGQLPAVFLKGCGLSDWEIEAAKLHNPNLTEDERTAIAYEILRIQGQRLVQLNPLFVSYSSVDASFVEALEPHFDKLGIRYWRDVHDLKAGRLETQIDRAIRLNPTVLLVLSEKSVESDWVEWEVATARRLEKDLKQDVLCPVALDDAWKTCSWPGPLRRQIEDYHILDFSAWEDAGSFEGQFGKLLEGLKLFYRDT